MKKARAAVFVSGGGTNLQALLDASKNGDMPHCELALVLSNKPEVYALERAKKAGIKNVVIDKKSCSSQEEFEKLLAEKMHENKIDVIILAGFTCILSENFVKQYPKRMINVHPSLIPSFCGKGFYGLKVHEAALDYGVKLTGATVHYVNEVADGGEIILQKAVNIREGDTPELLQKRVMEEAEWILLPKAAEIMCRRFLGENKNKTENYND